MDPGLRVSKTNNVRNIKVSWRGTVLQYELDVEETSLEQLIQKLSQDTNVAPEQMRLLYRGRLDQKDRTKLLKDLVGANSTIMLMGSRPEEISKMNQRVDDASQTKLLNRSTKTRSGVFRQPKPDPDSLKYTFGEIRTLPFPNRDQAHHYLERLRQDAGIRAIMVKYKWYVPLLTELDPATNTGHGSMYLGFNKNAGQEIQLRIRTDDYAGFRHYKTVRYALLHELAHNVHSEHDAKFHRFLNQLEKDVLNLDPFSGSGAILSTEDSMYSQSVNTDDSEVQEQRRQLILQAATKRNKQ